MQKEKNTNALIIYDEYVKYMPEPSVCVFKYIYFTQLS